MTGPERLIATAEDQIGYLGKKSNAQLDDFTANAGGLYNKFARDLDVLGDLFNGKKNGYDWCAVFVLWLFVKAFGREIAQKMLNVPNNSLAAGCGYALNYYKQKGRLFTAPEPADQIFFGTAATTDHTGIVTAVKGGYVHTIEGNAGSPTGVHAFQYPVGYARIKGYGRPDWSLVPEEKVEEDPEYERWKQYMERYRAELAALPVPEWGAVNWETSKTAGIVDGTRPMDLLTRIEAAVMMSRAEK